MTATELFGSPLADDRPSSFCSLFSFPSVSIPPHCCKLRSASFMTLAAPQEIVSAHSPDSDDAFMFYGLATKKVRSPRVTFRHVLEDIETLNRKAMEGL